MSDIQQIALNAAHERAKTLDRSLSMPEAVAYVKSAMLTAMLRAGYTYDALSQKERHDIAMEARHDRS